MISIPLYLYYITLSRSIMSDSLRPHVLQPTRLLCPWDSPGKNTGVGCHFLLQGIFPTQESNPGLPHCRQTQADALTSEPPGSPIQYLQMMKFLHLVLCPWICSSVSWFIVYGNWNRICILLQCENCININYVELVHSAFLLYPFTFLSIHSINF